MSRTYYFTSPLPFIGSYPSLVFNEGRQVNWANVPNTYINAATGKKVLPPGTVMSEEAADSTGAKKIIPRATGGALAAKGLLATAAVEGDPTAAKSGYGMIIGGLIFENMLPDFSNAAWASTWRGELLTAGVTSLLFDTYNDSRIG